MKLPKPKLRRGEKPAVDGDEVSVISDESGVEAVDAASTGAAGAAVDASTSTGDGKPGKRKRGKPKKEQTEQQEPQPKKNRKKKEQGGGRLKRPRKSSDSDGKPKKTRKARPQTVLLVDDKQLVTVSVVDGDLRSVKEHDNGNTLGRAVRTARRADVVWLGEVETRVDDSRDAKSKSPELLSEALRLERVFEDNERWGCFVGSRGIALPDSAAKLAAKAKRMLPVGVCVDTSKPGVWLFVGKHLSFLSAVHDGKVIQIDTVPPLNTTGSGVAALTAAYDAQGVAGSDAMRELLVSHIVRLQNSWKGFTDLQVVAERLWVHGPGAMNGDLLGDLHQALDMPVQAVPAAGSTVEERAHLHLAAPAARVTESSTYFRQAERDYKRIQQAARKKKLLKLGSGLLVGLLLFGWAWFDGRGLAQQVAELESTLEELEEETLDLDFAANQAVFDDREAAQRLLRCGQEAPTEHHYPPHAAPLIWQSGEQWRTYDGSTAGGGTAVPPELSRWQVTASGLCQQQQVDQLRLFDMQMLMTALVGSAAEAKLNGSDVASRGGTGWRVELTSSASSSGQQAGSYQFQWSANGSLVGSWAVCENADALWRNPSDVLVEVAQPLLTLVAPHVTVQPEPMLGNRTFTVEPTGVEGLQCSIPVALSTAFTPVIEPPPETVDNDDEGAA